MADESAPLDHVCSNCHSVHPAAPFVSDLAICLRDPEFEPYLDDILERQDFSRCQDMVRRKRFAWDRDACANFEPVEDVDDTEGSPELAAKILDLAQNAKLTQQSLQQAIFEDAVARIDWAKRPVDDYLRQLTEATTAAGRREAVQAFGFLIGQGNRAAFSALCRYLRALPPAASVPDKTLRVDILTELSRAREPDRQTELAHLLVDDLLRTPSNNTTRGWFSAVLRYFERDCTPEIAEEALARILDSPQFSYRIKRRVREILGMAEESDSLF